MEAKRFPKNMIRDRGLHKYRTALNLDYELAKKIFRAEAVILDLGCGTGKFVKKMYELGFNIWGTDMNITRTAGDRIIKARFDSLKKHFPEQKFDTIFAVASQGFYAKSETDINLEYGIIEQLLNENGTYLQVVFPYIASSDSIIVELQRISKLTQKGPYYPSEFNMLYERYYNLATNQNKTNKFQINTGQRTLLVDLYRIGEESGLKVKSIKPVGQDATTLLGCIVVEWVKPADNQVEP